MRKILILDGHPAKESYVSALCDAYATGATASGFEVRRLNIRDLTFDSNLRLGYQQIQELEPDLRQAQEHIGWCEHLVFAFPMWWGSMPARTKGFFERCWLPGFAFKYREDSPLWDRLLAGRSARLIVTSDAPVLFNVLAYWNAPYITVRKMIFRFCGFKPVKTTAIGGVKGLPLAARQRWLDHVQERLGAPGR